MVFKAIEVRDAMLFLCGVRACGVGLASSVLLSSCPIGKFWDLRRVDGV